MTSQEFIIWLKGFIEGTSASRDLTNEEEIILNKLKEVGEPKTIPNTKDNPWIGKDIDPINPYKGPWKNPYEIKFDIPDEIPYHEICSCNSKNGGIGICGCVMGNKMVPNPKKYGTGTTSTGTSTTITYTCTDVNTGQTTKQILKG